jgi:hypothetical protein
MLDVFFDVKTQALITDEGYTVARRELYPKICYQEKVTVSLNIKEVIDTVITPVDISDIASWEAGVDSDFDHASSAMAVTSSELFDTSQASSGVLRFPVDANTISWKTKVGTSSEKDAYLEVKGYASSGIMTRRFLIPIKAQNLVVPSGEPAPTPAQEYYNMSQVNGIASGLNTRISEHESLSGSVHGLIEPIQEPPVEGVWFPQYGGSSTILSKGLKHNLTATSEPTTHDYQDYTRGSLWVSSSSRVFVCLNNPVVSGEALWYEITDKISQFEQTGANGFVITNGDGTIRQSIYTESVLSGVLQHTANETVHVPASSSSDIDSFLGVEEFPIGSGEYRPVWNASLSGVLPHMANTKLHVPVGTVSENGMFLRLEEFPIGSGEYYPIWRVGGGGGGAPVATEGTVVLVGASGTFKAIAGFLIDDVNKVFTIHGDYTLYQPPTTTPVISSTGVSRNRSNFRTVYWEQGTSGSTSYQAVGRVFGYYNGYRGIADIVSTIGGYSIFGDNGSIMVRCLHVDPYRVLGVNYRLTTADSIDLFLAGNKTITINGMDSASFATAQTEINKTAKNLNGFILTVNFAPPSIGSSIAGTDYFSVSGGVLYIRTMTAFCVSLSSISVDDTLFYCPAEGCFNNVLSTIGYKVIYKYVSGSYVDLQLEPLTGSLPDTGDTPLNSARFIKGSRTVENTQKITLTGFYNGSINVTGHIYKRWVSSSGSVEPLLVNRCDCPVSLYPLHVFSDLYGLSGTSGYPTTMVFTSNTGKITYRAYQHEWLPASPSPYSSWFQRVTFDTCSDVFMWGFEGTDWFPVIYVRCLRAYRSSFVIASNVRVVELDVVQYSDIFCRADSSGEMVKTPYIPPQRDYYITYYTGITMCDNEVSLRSTSLPITPANLSRLGMFPNEKNTSSYKRPYYVRFEGMAVATGVNNLVTGGNGSLVLFRSELYMRNSTTGDYEAVTLKYNGTSVYVDIPSGYDVVQGYVSFLYI